MGGARGGEEEAVGRRRAVATDWLKGSGEGLAPQGGSPRGGKFGFRKRVPYQNLPTLFQPLIAGVPATRIKNDVAHPSNVDAPRACLLSTPGDDRPQRREVHRLEERARELVDRMRAVASTTTRM